MIKTLNITNFRCFRSLAVRNLTRVNLLVGQNNHGKTSVLEAIYTLVRCADALALDRFMSRREETLQFTSSGSVHFHELDIRRLFLGHVLREGSSFSVSATDLGRERAIEVRVMRGQSSTVSEMPNDPSPRSPADALWMRIDSRWSGKKPWHRDLPISSLGGVNPLTTSLPEHKREHLSAAAFVSSDDSASTATAEYWSEIALTENEKRVEDCLRIIEPSLQRIAFVQDRTHESGIFRVKLTDQVQPVPLGSMGAGTSRLLALAIALVESRNGFLFVDEIDTGLHHSILDDVWKFVIDVAEQLNVQVFATTHSLDCVRGLARICNDSDSDSDNGENDRISMHRIERGNSESIHYSEAQIVIAASEGIETR
ncbi:MAG: AAA family ATPase [Planctomycetaceae bacterium]|nr:AAA family ATPase [Planctomycetaceae bacterium]